MKMRNTFFCTKWKRCTALLLAIVMIFAQPSTVLADAGIRRAETGAGKAEVTESVEDMEKYSLETESEENEEVSLNWDSEEISEEELQSEMETEVLTEAFTEIETEDADDIEMEDSAEENLLDIETEEKVTEDMETESETVVFEDNFSQKGTSEKTYAVTFIADNVIVDKQTVTEGEAAEEPGAPEKPGYTFLGWSGDYTRVTNNRNVYAQYAVGEFATHVVTFRDYDGRLVGNRQYVQDGGSAASPAVQERAGYTFLGWDESRFYIREDKTLNAQYREGVYKTYTLNYYGYRDNKATQQILKEEIVVEGEDGVPPEPEVIEGYTFAGWDRDRLYTNVYRNQTIKALYYKGKYSTHKVEFVDYNGKALMNPQHIPDGESAYSPLIPVREGHTFIGWDKSRFWIHKDTKLTARYREGEHKTYTLNYYGYRNNKATQQILKEEIVVEGEDGVPPEPEEIEGYTFAGWDRNFLYTNVYRNQTIKATYYTGKYHTHKVEFVDYNGKALLNPQYIVDGESAYSPSKPVREGHTFIGWDESRFWIHKDTKLTARYREGAHKTYTLNYYGYRNNKATQQILKEEIVVEGEDGVPPEPEEIEGYTFAGWDRNFLYTNVYRNQTIKATYYTGKYRTHKVEFVDYNGKALLNPQYIIDGESAFSPLKPVREGYTFIGWDKSRFWIHKDTKLTARYREGEHKTYTLNYYGYRNNKATQQILKEEIVVEGEDGVPPEPEEIEGYTFAGWDRNFLYTNVYRNQTIKATYYTGKYRTHKVEFVDYNGKALLNPQYIVDGGSAFSPPKPVREGYTFIGWDKENFRIASPVKIQALYKEGIYLTCPVSFYVKITGNPSWQLLKTEYVPVGDDAHPPKLPVNSGYTFREWSGQITGIQTAQNVYAQYNKNTETETTYTVRFWCRGEIIKTEEVAIGGNATPPAVPGLKGYSFAGWDKSYVNINPGTRSMAVDITAQYQLTSGIQNAGSVSDLVNALMALGVPVAVKNGFSALGAAIINPFDGIILDVLAATALVGTIIYYWDDIKDLWSDIKVIFRNFAGMDAAGEILDNIEAGVDEAGKEDGDSEAVYAQAAIDARDAEIARICELSNTQRDKYVVVVAGYNKNTGQVAVGAKIEETGMRTYCAEDMVVAQLIEKGATLKEIVMTPGIRPRTMEIIAVCKFCQEKYSRDNFIPGTPFE